MHKCLSACLLSESQSKTLKYLETLTSKLFNPSHLNKIKGILFNKLRTHNFMSKNQSQPLGTTR